MTFHSERSCESVTRSYNTLAKRDSISSRRLSLSLSVRKTLRFDPLCSKNSHLRARSSGQFSIIHSYSLSLFLPFFFFFCLVDEKLKQKEKEKEKSDFLFLFLLCFVIWNRKNHLHETTKLVDSHSYAWKTKKGVRFLIFKASRLKLLTPFPFLLFSFTFLAAKQNLQQQFNSVYIYVCLFGLRLCLYYINIDIVQLVVWKQRST